MVGLAIALGVYGCLTLLVLLASRALVKSEEEKLGRAMIFITGTIALIVSLGIGTQLIYNANTTPQCECKELE